MNTILVEQYNVEGLSELLLSSRSFKRHDSHFECCSECFNSLKPSKKDTKTSPRHANASGLAIGHIPSVLLFRL